MEKSILSDSELDRVAGGAGGSVVASGSFSSSTGTQLNLQVNWSSQAEASGRRTLYVDVCANSYSLYSNGGGVELTVNGMLYAANAAAVSYGGKTPVTKSLTSGSEARRRRIVRRRRSSFSAHRLLSSSGRRKRAPSRRPCARARSLKNVCVRFARSLY